jgi:hypothetical protein
MGSVRSLAGVAHDIAHHAGSGLSFLSPHMSQALCQAGLITTTVELLELNPYPKGAAELQPLRLALQSLHEKAEVILTKYGFAVSDVKSIHLSATSPPWNKDGYILHTRAIVTAANGKSFDSGWLGAA